MRPSPLFVVLPLSFALLACNTAKLSPAPDASPNCAEPIAEAPCQPLEAGAAGCTGDLGSGPVLDRDVTVDASYPAACTLIINDPTPDDQNHCVQLGTCHCDADGGAFAWHCYK